MLINNGARLAVNDRARFAGRVRRVRRLRRLRRLRRETLVKIYRQMLMQPLVKGNMRPKVFFISVSTRLPLSTLLPPSLSSI